eukprot:8518692-Lingulodinium_polyedra.AAC.1
MGEIDWANRRAKPGPGWYTEHIKDGVMGWHARDVVNARTMECDAVIRVWGRTVAANSDTLYHV